MRLGSDFNRSGFPLRLAASGLLLVWCASAFSPASASDGHSDTSTLDQNTTTLTDVLPQYVLDDLTLPEPNPAAKNRVQEKSENAKLKWRSRKDSSDKKSASTAQKAKSNGPLLVPARSKQGPAGARIAQLPKVERSSPKQQPETAESKTPAEKQEKAKPVEEKPEQEATTKKAPAEESTAANEKKADREASAEPAKEPVAVAPKEAATPEPLPRNLQMLRERMRTVLSYYYRRPLNSVENDPWEIMHSMLSYELHSKVRDGGQRGKPMTAIGFLCYNKPAQRKQMMYITQHGELDVRVAVGMQGHKGQLLAMLAQCNVSPDYPIRVQNKEFTLHDLIKAEQRTCYARSELTFKLIGLGHYLDQGESWDIPRLIREERTQPIRGAACGGTHRLAGLSLAWRRREARGEPVDGEYLEAANFVRKYQNYAFRLQNRDGSLSTEWFRGRGAEASIERRLRTTGHLLEWLAYSLSDEELRQPNAVRAATYLTNLLANYGKQDWHKGSLGHALHALVLYDKRVFQPTDGLDAAGASQITDAVNPASNQYRGYATRRGVMRGGSQPEEKQYFGLFGNTSRR